MFGKTTRRWAALGVAFTFVGTVLQACSGPAGADGDQVTIRMLSAWDDSVETIMVGLDMFREEVEKQSDGAIQIEVVAGPESVDPLQTGEVIGGGTVDMSFASGGYYWSVLPEVAAMLFTETSPQEQRDSGAFARMDELHREKMNAALVGQSQNGVTYTFYTTFQVDSLEDFRGKRFRVSPAYLPVTEALGIEPVTMPPSDLYTALERDVIDGFIWPELGIQQFGVEDFLAYQVRPGFFRGETTFLANLDFWDSLTDDQRAIIESAAQEVEEQQLELYEDMAEQEVDALAEAGIEQVNLPEQEAQRLLEIARTESARWLMENVKPTDVAEELVELYQLG